MTKTRRSRWLRRGLLLAAGLGVLGFALAASGIIPLRASSGHWAVTEWVLRFGMKRSIATHSLTVKAPENLADPALIRKGAAYYDFGCRSCHGAPGSPLPALAARMLPAPPRLSQRIQESDAEALFYVVKHGMKFTGMPAWPAAGRDDEVWPVVAFLLKYPELGASAYAELAGQPERAAALATPRTVPWVVAQKCVSCHGADGAGRGGHAMPRLAGQRAEYLAEALTAFASGQRHSGMMAVAASGLSPSEIATAAGYYAALPAPTSATAIDPAAIVRGARIAREGIPGARVPACIECHGADAPRGKPEFPLLAGQPAGYLRQQLELFHREARGGGAHATIMRPIAGRLTPGQMQDLAAFYASLTPER